MPDGMPGIFAKGILCRQVDGLLNDPTNTRDKVGQLFSTHGSVVGVLSNLGFDQELINHLQAHVFADQPPGMWPHYPDKNEIIREGVLKALELAETTVPNKHISCFWACAGHYFQVAIAEVGKDGEGLAVVFLTPTVPSNVAPAATPEDEQVWLVVCSRDADEIDRAAQYPVGDANHQPIDPAQLRPVDQRPVRETRSGDVAVYQVKGGRLPL